MENKRKIGSDYERIAVEYLETHGYFIKEINFRCRFGEIDIVAKDKNYLVFIEVKYRKNQKTGYPMEAVNTKKQQTISKVADYYCMRYGIGEDVPLRFDVVGILDSDIQLIQNAFSYQGGR